MPCPTTLPKKKQRKIGKVSTYQHQICGLLGPLGISPQKGVFPGSHEVQKKTLKRANAGDLRMGHVKSNRSMASHTTETSGFSGANGGGKTSGNPLIIEFSLEHDQKMWILHTHWIWWNGNVCWDSLSGKLNYLWSYEIKRNICDWNVCITFGASFQLIFSVFVHAW